jgi:hypothetical protein
MGDTTRPSQEMFNNVKPKRLAQKIEMKGQVKGRIDAKSKRAKENNFENQIPLKGRVVDWYEDLSTMTWDETKKKFGKQVGR